MKPILKLREYRSKKLHKVGKLLLKAHISANQLTSYSLIAGLLAVYFLFNNYWLFVLFALLHLLFDAVDGVVARISGPTKWGAYFDFCTDRIVEFLVLIKLVLFLNNYYVYFVLGLFCLTTIIHLLSKTAAPLIINRTVTLILLMIFTYPSMPYALLLVNLICLTAGITYVYSLIKQGQWVIIKSKKSKKSV